MKKLAMAVMSAMCLILALLSIPVRVGAEGTQAMQNPLAYISGDGNIYLADLNTRLSIPITDDSAREFFQAAPFFRTTRSYGQIAWYPDGTGNALVFVDRITKAIYVTPSGQRPRKVGTLSADHGYPPAWVNGQLAWATAGDGLTRRIVAQELTATAEAPREVGRFTEVGACVEPISVDPAESMYWAETGSGGATALLAWLPEGFLRFSACDHALIYTRPDGSVIWRIEHIQRAVVSPAGNKIAKIAVVRVDPTSQQTALARVEVETGQVQDMLSQIGLDQIAWQGDTLIYSTRVNSPGEPANPLSAAGVQVFPGVWPLNYNQFALTLWTIPVSGGAPRRLYDGVGYALASLAGTPDGTGIAFSVISSSAEVVRRINAGASIAEIAAAAPTSQMWYRSIIEGTQAVPIIGGGQLVYLAGPYTAAIGAQGPGALDPAATLIISRPALVTVTPAESLNLRAAPGFAASIIRPLKAAEIVDVIGGPQFADGGRWWQLRTYDRLTGWALDRAVASGRSVINLRPLASGIAITFNVDKRIILPGECVMLTWRVEGALSLTLNGRDVLFAGRESVCPSQNMPFVLMALGADGGAASGFVVNINASPRG